jgi:hypothetical protein
MNMNVFSGAAAGAANAYKEFVGSDAVEKVAAAAAQNVGEMEDAQTFSKTVDPETAGDIIQSRTKSMSELPKPAKAKEVDKTKAVADKIVNKEDELDKDATKFTQGKREFDKENLKKLHEKIKNDDTPESIIAKVKEHFPSKTPASQILDALEFLTISIKDPKTKGIVENAKAQYNEQNKDAIAGGREMTKLAYEAANQGLGTVKQLHGVFVDIVANENSAANLYKQLCVQYPVYKDLMKMITFVQSESGKALHDPLIDHTYLMKLNTTTKDLQSLVMVYRGFEKKMPQMDKQMHNAIQHFEEMRAVA